MRGGIAGQRLLGLSACCLIMAGCAGSGGSDPGSGTALGNLLAFNSVKAPPMPAAATEDDSSLACPIIEVLDGTASSRVYGAGEQTNNNVRTQFSMGDVVRECHHSGSELVLKIGVEGRVLLGPVGAPGSFAAPVRIAVRRDKDDKVVASKLYKVPVTIPAGASEAPFSLVSDPLAVPFITEHADGEYTILVGFDAKGDGGASDPKPRTRRDRKG